jgi:hypothetical protein
MPDSPRGKRWPPTASAGALRLVQISPNPFVTTFEARMVCAENNVAPNF